VCYELARRCKSPLRAARSGTHSPRQLHRGDALEEGAEGSLRDPPGKDDTSPDTEVSRQGPENGLFQTSADQKNDDFRLSLLQERNGTEQPVQALVEIK
jgi:hypothetical protein